MTIRNQKSALKFELTKSTLFLKNFNNFFLSFFFLQGRVHRKECLSRYPNNSEEQKIEKSNVNLKISKTVSWKLYS